MNTQNESPEDPDFEKPEDGQVATPPLTPIEDKLTLHPDDETGPTGDDNRPDVFVPGDQTAAGALTPDGAKNPGEPSGLPGEAANLLDPYGVNGAVTNQAAIESGDGIENPDLHEPDVPEDETERRVNPDVEVPEGTPLTAEEREANGLPPLDE